MRKEAEIELDELLGMLQGGYDPVMEEYKKGLENRTIIINQAVDTSIIEMAVLPLRRMDEDGTGKPITVVLNSPGGALYTGMALVAQLEKMKTPTTVIVEGMACSMGFMFLIAGANNPNVTRVCNKYSIGLLHGGSQLLEGTTHAVKDTFKFSEKYEEIIKDFVVAHTKIDSDTYDRNERVEWYMTSKEMLSLGVVDEIR